MEGPPPPRPLSFPPYQRPCGPWMVRWRAHASASRWPCPFPWAFAPASAKRQCSTVRNPHSVPLPGAPWHTGGGSVASRHAVAKGWSEVEEQTKRHGVAGAPAAPEWGVACNRWDWRPLGGAPGPVEGRAFLVVKFFFVDLQPPSVTLQLLSVALQPPLVAQKRSRC